MRLLVLTSIIVTAASAAAGTRGTPLRDLGDRAPDAAVSGAPDQDLDRPPADDAPVVALVTPVATPPLVATAAAAVPLKPTPAAAAVLAFAPKTSPPRARWF